MSDSLIDPEPCFVALSRKEQRFSVNLTIFRKRDRPTDRQTERPTDTAPYRDAWAHLKITDPTIEQEYGGSETTVQTEMYDSGDCALENAHMQT